MTRATALLLLACFFSFNVGLVAQEMDSPSDAEVTDCLRAIQGALDAGQTAANLWEYGWLVAYGAASVGQAAVSATTDDQRQHQDMLIGSVTSALGAAGQVVFPLRAGRFAARLRAMPGDTAEERRAKLQTAETWLGQAAAQEALGRSWKVQVVSVLVNGAAGLTTSLLFDRRARDGLQTFAIGQLVSEVQFFTQPTQAMRDLRAYRGRKSALSGGPTSSARARWFVGVSPTRFTIGRAF